MEVLDGQGNHLGFVRQVNFQVHANELTLGITDLCRYPSKSSFHFKIGLEWPISGVLKVKDSLPLHDPDSDNFRRVVCAQ